MKIYNKINKQYDSMSKSHKILSDFIINNKNVIPFLTITELSKESHVSTSTITRFAKELGFSGYLDLQKNIRTELTNELIPFEELRQLTEPNDNDESILQTIVNSNIDALKELNNKKNELLINEIVTLMLESKDIYIIASRSSYTVAYYLYFLLKSVRKETYLINSSNDGFIKEIQYADKDDMLIAISYSKYTSFTYCITEFFKLQKSKIVSITDSYESPISKNSDKTLVVKNGEKSFSFVATMTVINILVALYNQKANIGDETYEIQDLAASFFGVYL